MLYYLLHQSPLWETLSNGKRNIRILFLTLSIYICIHALAFEYKSKSIICKTIYDYFWWIFLADIFICGCYYKSYYGRSMLKELDQYENDAYDEKEHRYYQNNNNIKQSDQSQPNQSQSNQSQTSQLQSNQLQSNQLQSNQLQSNQVDHINQNLKLIFQ